MRAEDVQGVDVLEEGVHVQLRNLPGVSPFFPSRLGHLVFALVGVAGHVADVGDVDDLNDLVSEVFESAPEDVGEDEGAEVAYGRVVVDRGAAVVHAHPSGLHRLELFLASGQCVEDPQHAFFTSRCGEWGRDQGSDERTTPGWATVQRYMNLGGSKSVRPWRRIVTVPLWVLPWEAMMMLRRLTRRW